MSEAVNLDRLDAERWRWFRAHWHQVGFATHVNDACTRSFADSIILSPQMLPGDEASLDVAIDAARERNAT